MKKLAPILLVASVAIVLGLSAFADGSYLPPEEAKALVKKGAMLVDVRTPEEFAGKHLDGAINIPVDDLEARMGELKKDADIVLYCRSGARSGRALGMLKAAGFTKVYNLGGIGNWK